MINFLDQLDIEGLKKDDIQMMNPLVLAYIGDAVYDMYIRTYIVTISRKNVNELNKMAVGFVKASAQAEIARFLEPELTEAEERILKRGRNQKSSSVAKNASIGDYRLATGFESLIGWLYLNDNFERMDQLISLGIKHIEGKIQSEDR